MLLDTPVTLTEAAKIMLSKKIMPTSLDSTGIRQLDAALRRQSMTSSQTLLDYLLEAYRTVITSQLGPGQELRRDELSDEDRMVTVGYNPATARAAIRQLLQEQGYLPPEGTAGTIKDLSSDARINLVIQTNTQLAQGAGAFIQQNDEDVIDSWPALELVRYEDRERPRDWEQRWKIACEVANDPKAMGAFGRSGRMVALKDSEVWQALGDGEGGYTDTLGNPYPPFAFNSGMWTDDVSYNEAVELGLLNKGDKPKGADFNFASLFSTEDAA
jgi:hypothetical protein